MPVQINDLQFLLQQLVAEHEKMLRLLEDQHRALRALDARRVQELSAQQEASRLRIAGLESRRRLILQQLCVASRLAGEPTITRLAAMFPQAGETLLALRDKLKSLAAAISNRAQIAGKVAGALLGHLNTVVRLIAGATEQAGLYNKQGVHAMASRIGVMEAVA
ncbi:MAG: flagellar protein FlgN [Tepidisphaerales bacterium]